MNTGTTVTRNYDGYLTLGDAAQHVGRSENLLRRRIRAGVLSTFIDPLDRRKLLIRVDDIESLRVIRPTERRAR